MGGAGTTPAAASGRAPWLTARRVTFAGLGTNAVLCVSKIAVGLLLGSQAILADGVHAASDVVTDLAVLAGIGRAEKPADACHPYGHQRIGTLVAMFVGIFLALAAAWILYQAVVSLSRPRVAVSAGLPLALAIGSIPLKELLYQLTIRVGRRDRNASLRANAWHHRSDAFTSVAAAAGLAGVAIGGQPWAFLDPAVAMMLGGFLLVVAGRIILQNAGELVDRAPSEELVRTVERIVADTQGVLNYHAFRARRMGDSLEMDVHIRVDPTLTVRQGHDIATAVEKRLLDSDVDVAKVTVHVEPAAQEPAQGDAPAQQTARPG